MPMTHLCLWSLCCKHKKYFGVMGISDAFYGTKMLLNPNIVSNYLERMNGANVELTQSVSQMTGPTVIFMSNDLLQTKRMTIEDLIESSEGVNFPSKSNFRGKKWQPHVLKMHSGKLFKRWNEMWKHMLRPIS